MAENNFGSSDVTVKASNPLKDWVSVIVIFGSLVLGYLVYAFVLGDGANFVDGKTENHPLTEGFRHWLGLMYKGGPLVGLGIALLLIVCILTVERVLTLNKARGRGRPEVFVQKIQMYLDNNDVDSAIAECDAQRGTVGNVVREALRKYKAVANDPNMDKEQKVEAIKLAIEEATALELPMLEKHLVVIATIVSIATLIGLIGTVLGMIRAFAALGAGGAPDTAALSVGISEALINTFLGISTSTISTVAYNYFTSSIDGMTYRIDEVGMSIVETFKTKY